MHEPTYRIALSRPALPPPRPTLPHAHVPHTLVPIPWLVLPQVLQRMGVPGVLVLEVPPGSPAAAAGIRPTHRDIFGDLILVCGGAFLVCRGALETSFWYVGVLWRPHLVKKKKVLGFACVRACVRACVPRPSSSFTCCGQAPHLPPLMWPSAAPPHVA